MEIEHSKKALTFIGIIILIMSLFVVYQGSSSDLTNEKETCSNRNAVMASVKSVSSSKTCTKENNNDNKKTSIKKEVINSVNNVTAVDVVDVKLVEEKVWDNLTLEQLTDKLDRSLNSNLKGKGYIFANYTKETGLDPYLAVAIVLEESGCSYACSALVNSCNNVAGIKGNGSCNGYQGYSSLDEGIKSYLKYLYNDYYKKGLKTPEDINPIYAENADWAYKIRNYMDYVKSR